VPKRFHFISGLPRSGSTLLSAILRQNPRFHAGMSSPVSGMFRAILNIVSAGGEFAGQISSEKRQRLLSGLFDNYYADCDKEVIFDTNRAWTSHVAAIKTLFPEAKFICCVRDIAWIMDSMERQYRKDPFENTRLFNDDIERASVYSRVEALGRQNRMVGSACSMLKEAYYAEEADALLLVDYDLLSSMPHKVLPLIYEFLGEETFQHNFDHVEYDAPGFDANLGVDGLHRISGPVRKNERRTILPPDLFQKYAEMTFWHDPKGTTAHVIAPKASAGDIRAAVE
jgi:sulfotransferase